MPSDANETDPANTEKWMERLNMLENANTIPRSNTHRSVPSVTDLFGPQPAVQENLGTRHLDETTTQVSYERVVFDASPQDLDHQATSNPPKHPLQQSTTLSSENPNKTAPNHDTNKSHRPRDHHHHNRNVSWGDEWGLLSGVEKNQRARTEDNSLDSYPSHTHRPTKSFDTFSLQSPHPRMVVLDDVLKCNPLETEAEALIMRVLEEQDNANRDRANTESSGILANVPEDTNVFSKAESSFDSMDGSTEDSEAQPFLEDKGSEEEKTRRKHGPKRHPRRSHRRENTMESHLMDLTEVLTELHGVSSALPDQEYTKGTVDSSSGMALAENANRIFRQNVKADLESGGYVSNDIKDNNNIEAGYNDTSKHSQQSGRKVAFVADDENNNGDLELSHVDEVYEEDETSSRHENQSERSAFKSHKSEKRLFAKILGWFGRGLISDAITFLSARSKSMRYYSWAYMSIVAPLISVAFILFYLADNPPTGRLSYNVTSVFDPVKNATVLVNTEGEGFEARTASASWWLLFIVRQLSLFTVARLLQLIVIDFFCLSTRMAVKLFGQLITLFIVQSKGWPFVVLVWGILDFSFLAGKTPWANHWAYGQDLIGLFNYQNPSGSVPSHALYIRILSIAVTVAVVVSVKRLWLGFALGRKTYRFYAEDLAKVMKKIILLSKVAIVARELARLNSSGRTSRGKRQSLVDPDQYSHLVRFQTKGGYDTDDSDNLDDSTKASNKSETNHDHFINGGLIISNSKESDGYRVLSHAEKTRLNELLGFWEEPEKEFGIEDSISINAILQFRQSLKFIENRFMFSLAFGDVSSRENMVVSAQKLFQRLNSIDGKEDNLVEISFDVLALAAVDGNEELDEMMLKDLIRLLRPDRNGKLKLLEFVKSIDAVYKEAKLLRAAVNSSEKIDKAFENVIDAVFYIIALCIILNQLGLNPLAVFLSLSSFVLAFAFMIGSASSRLFEGWMMVLLQRPYDIGDRIHVSNVQSDSNLDGSFGWIVKDVTLYTTTVVFQPNNERATISNGSMASSRIINAARSPKAVVFVNLKFSTSVPYERLKVFEEALRKFIRNRPREWASFITFRVLRIHVEQGYIEYITILQHREAWQEIFTIQESRSEVAAFCHELSKKMGMRYKSPPLPVSLGIVKSDQSTIGGHTEMPMGEDSLYSEIVSANALFDRMQNDITS